MIVDNFRKTEIHKSRNILKLLRQKIDKGHKNQFHEFVQRIQKGGMPLIPIKEIINVSEAFLLRLTPMKRRIIWTYKLFY